MPTVLQISDPHLMSTKDGTLKGVPTYESLRHVLEKARTVIADPDVVVWSGDLSHEHTADGYELIAEQAGDWLERSLFIPGNHDDRTEMRRVLPGIDGESDQEVGFRYDLDDWLLVGLDSHVPDQVYGELSEATIEQLHFWLSENPERQTVIFLHHPPVEIGSAWVDAIRLRNPEPLGHHIGRNQGVKAVFCGHVHQQFEGIFAGVAFHSAPSASFQFKPASESFAFDMIPPGFRVIRLNDDPYDEVQVETELFRLDEMPFKPLDQ